jgi:hypothetical protein
MLKELIHANIHVVPLILGKPMDTVEGFWYGSNLEEAGYITIEEISRLSCLDEGFKAWLADVYYSEPIQHTLMKYIDVRVRLGQMREVVKRRELLNEERKLFE